MQDKTDETDTDSEPKVKEEMEVEVDEATITGVLVEEKNPLEIKKEEPSESETTDQSTPSTECKEKKVEEDETAEEKASTNKLKRKRRWRKRPNKVQRKAGPQEYQTESSNSGVVEEEALEPVVMETTVKIEPQVRVQEDVEYVLTVSNMPNTWTYMDIKNYIDTEIEPVDEMELVKDEKTGKGAIRLSYQSEEQCKSAMGKLQSKEIEGNKLTVEMTVETIDSDSDTNATDEIVKRPWRPDMDEWEIDPKGLYGLKPEFLKSLNIVPPIDKWVHVSNFRCDKSELRDIMELAGKVLSCSVFTVINKYANVQYSHPLEAVQAVSMLNDAMYYGQKLKVQLERSPSDTVFLPKGLTTVGQGLGVNGKPLRNIVKHYKKLLANEPSLLNPCVVNLPDGSVPKKTPEVHFEIKTLTTKTTTGVQKSKPVQTIANQNSTQNNNSPNVAAKPKNSPNAIPTVSRPQIQPKLNNANFRPSVPFNRGPRPMGPGPMGPGPMGPGPMGPGPMGPGPMGPGPMGPGPMGPGPMGPGSMGPSPIGPGPFGPRPMGPRTMGQYGNGWNGPGPMQGPMPGPGPMTPGPMMPGPMPVQNMGPFNSNEPVQLQLSNLPPSTTFAILCEKMAQCGQVVAIQLTTPGCAVVTFGNRMQADYCIKTYNGNYVDGHVIQIKYS